MVKQKVNNSSTVAGSAGDSNILKLAQEESRRLNHNFVGTEQILIALILCRSGIAHQVLAELGLTVEDARAEVEAITGRGSGFVAAEIPFTPRAKRVVELSWEEARQLGHNYIDSEHLLLALLHEGEGVGAKILEKLKIDGTSVRECIYKSLKSIKNNDH